MNPDKNLTTGFKPTVAIIGAGPAGLMAAEVLSLAGVKVNIYDGMPSVGRKLLMAGKGGLNITHAENFDTFITRYGGRGAHVTPILQNFSPEQVRDWLKGLAIGSFVGTSGRVFPDDMKAGPLLRRWVHRLRESGVSFFVRHVWTGWLDEKTAFLNFNTPQGAITVQADAVILALGGGSWPQLGSTGTWPPFLAAQGILVAPLKPANCGFDSDWSDYFKTRFAGEAVKPVRLSFSDGSGFEFSKLGEIIVTAYGLEGSLIYAASAGLRDSLAIYGQASVELDLCPDRSLAWLANALSAPRGKLSFANYLRKRIGIDGVKAGLIRELVPVADLSDPDKLASALKALNITLVATRPIAEAISSAGGVSFEALDKQLMARAKPGLFCAGEMLDWEAPTGGYLLSFCLASGRTAGLGALDWLASQRGGRYC